MNDYVHVHLEKIDWSWKNKKEYTKIKDVWCDSFGEFYCNPLGSQSQEPIH